MSQPSTRKKPDCRFETAVHLLEAEPKPKRWDEGGTARSERFWPWGRQWGKTETAKERQEKQQVEGR